jgi:hypothetical protein
VRENGYNSTAAVVAILMMMIIIIMIIVPLAPPRDHFDSKLLVLELPRVDTGG